MCSHVSRAGWAVSAFNLKGVDVANLSFLLTFRTGAFGLEVELLPLELIGLAVAAPVLTPAL
jgi:hypothetical protein